MRIIIFLSIFVLTAPSFSDLALGDFVKYNGLFPSTTDQLIKNVVDVSTDLVDRRINIYNRPQRREYLRAIIALLRHVSAKEEDKTRDALVKLFRKLSAKYEEMLLNHQAKSESIIENKPNLSELYTLASVEINERIFTIRNAIQSAVDKLINEDCQGEIKNCSLQLKNIIKTKPIVIRDDE